jgi:hypothetical protein
VNDLLNDALDVSVAFSIVMGPEHRSSLACVNVTSEDTSTPFTLTSNNSAHF